MEKPAENRHMTLRDLTCIGYSAGEAEHILQLLSDQELLEFYLHKAKKAGCMPITRISEGYPGSLRDKLADDSPGTLWAKGDVSLLDLPAISLVGNRDIRQENARFAQIVGEQAAKQGFVLVSGNAQGADSIAQRACLQHGGKVISVVADPLQCHNVQKNVLYLAEDSFDADFSSHRALSRNRVIHCLGLCVFVAQSAVGKSGTWDGTVKNLRNGWCPVYCYRDGSVAAAELEQRGAQLIDPEALSALKELVCDGRSLFDK
jgi:predicted Rossmann fold nucleotide-binding protein DprA/Smf involved in DNA uptake